MSEDRRREAMSIEHLLHWAYRDQMVHRARHLPMDIASPGGPLAAFSSLWDECAPVEGSRQSGFSAADDAWRINAEVEQLGGITIDCGQDLAAARYHRLGQYRGAEPPITRAATIDRSAGKSWPTNGLLKLDTKTLVILHASRGSRPPMPGPASVRFKPGPVVWHPKRKTKVYAKGWFCHVMVEGDLPGDVRAEAEIYQAWWRSLDRLRRALSAIRMTMFSVTDSMPPPVKNPGKGLAG